MTSAGRGPVPAIVGTIVLTGIVLLVRRDLASASTFAVTIAVGATVTEPRVAPMNPLEILEVRCFAPDALPTPLSHGMTEVLGKALAGESHWE